MDHIHCEACGHPTTGEDPAVYTTDSAIVHESHTADPASGLYGTRTED